MEGKWGGTREIEGEGGKKQEEIMCKYIYLIHMNIKNIYTGHHRQVRL